jgi:hypothetical protein
VGRAAAPTSSTAANPDDCGPAEFCAPDGTCQPGDCSFDGCIDGFFCNTLPESPVCDRLDSNGCGEDADCNTADGYLCVSGQCTAPADLCTDQTQCASGSVCAEGKCVPSCAGGGACPSDFTCTSPLELCNGAVTACTITDDCGGFDSVCVDGACVARSLDGTCPTGFAWVDNGCIPDQAAAFLCAIDGSQDACAAGSICLHHSCYISCEAPNETGLRRPGHLRSVQVGDDALGHARGLRQRRQPRQRVRPDRGQRLHDRLHLRRRLLQVALGVRDSAG